eukprot:TRINITY_DN366_c0_g1_i10.p1 TRINITY_DN366_c0_g1~~TRINITY_DN366_c0_g1_i10.p1  ORF type:complete len:573 (+),score=105.93 TRINITY_DN366_c0_g1_i10:115-1833(+)
MKLQSSVQLLIFFTVSVVTCNLNAKGFIRTQGTKFVDANCDQFVVNGWNSWEMMEGVLGKVGYTDYSTFQGKDPLSWMFDTAVSSNLNTFRIFGHGHDASIMTLQYSPGNYNYEALYALDVVLDAAAQRNIRAILTFVNNWRDVDSKSKYVEWSNSAGWGDDFYTDETAKNYFKNHMSFMVNRVNSVNGKTYRDDPTILAWNLINELRSDSSDCGPDCAQYIQNWIDEMSAYLKSVDPNHMITVGEEGFYGWHSGKDYVNPDAWNGASHTWSMKSGQNFYNNHAGRGIDFAGTHIWVDNWGITYDMQGFFSKWIEEHANDARALNKPLLIEEFGKESFNEYNFANERDPFFAIAYQKTIDSVRNDDVIQGTMWWEWENDEAGSLKEYDIKTYHTTWTQQIQPKSYELAMVRDAKPLLPNCIPGDSMSFEALFIDQNTDNFVYYMFRQNVVASNEGDTFYADGTEFVQGVSREECASRCESSQPSCTSFAYNVENGGTCYLKNGESDSSEGWYWSMDGWSTFWRRVGSYSDCTSDPNCYACSQEGICILCNQGSTLERSNDPFSLPYCTPGYQ